MHFFGNEPIVDTAWQRSKEGKQYMTCIIKGGKRKVFGFLERPALNPQLTHHVKTCKIFVCGKAGVGKTSTVAKLTGQTVPSSHLETPGIVSSVTYWPAKIVSTGKVILFRLQFWDTGDNIAKKYDHILPACKDNTVAILHLFSFVDRSSFEDLQNQFPKFSHELLGPLRIVVGTKYDQSGRSEITSRELDDFQKLHQVPLLKVTNVYQTNAEQGRHSSDSAGDGVSDVGSILNELVGYLWAQDEVLRGALKEYPWRFDTSQESDEVDGDDGDLEATYV